MKRKKWIHNIIGITLVLILLCICFTVSFFLTSLLYRKLGQSPPALLIQMINSFLGLILAAIIIKIGERFDKQTKSLFDSILTAQKQIASGDFNVSMDKNMEGLGPFSDLVDSVNKMAFELGKMEKMRQEFISNVSHEIQSPLTSIRGFSQALQNTNLSPEDQLQYLTIIENESMRLSRLSDNLLRLSSLETDTIPFEPKIYRLDRQLRSIILSCEPQWSDKKIEMDISMEEMNINADEDMMNQVWINLIHNSIKFTSEGGDISIYLCQHDDRIDVKISDTGVGISEKDQQFIFERFFKADKSRRLSIQGNGLGLSIVKKIIDIHQGTIHMKSKLGVGTTITISLPKI
jgi:two-component system, OmpR family, phosphate regulon sensor histidine kinase PhoR